MAEEKNIEELDSKNESTELRSIREIVKDLSKPVAKRHLRTRKQGGKELTYISWYDAVKYLDHYAPGWNYEVRAMNSVGGKLISPFAFPCRVSKASFIAKPPGRKKKKPHLTAILRRMPNRWLCDARRRSSV
jgi:hypothetical protein